jgi:hypothetical protein
MKTYLKLTLTIIIAAFFSSCDDGNEPDNRFKGTLDEVKEFFTPELVQVMSDLGMNINTGNTPPNLEGNYLAEVLLMATNVSGDILGQRFDDTVMKFEDQNNSDLTITFSYDQSKEKGNGIGALIAGTENSFSAFLKVNVTHGPQYDSAQTAMVISGKMTNRGISDFQWALFMLDNKGESPYIANNTGRVFEERDDLAEMISSGSSAKLTPTTGTILKSSTLR